MRGFLQLIFVTFTLCSPLFGCGQSIDAERQAAIEPAPACNGTAEEATPCLERKVLAWRTALALPGPESTYDVFEAACNISDPDGCWMWARALEGDGHMVEAMKSVQSFKPDKTDPELGAEFPQKSCELGSDYGCLNHAENLAEKANWNPEDLESLVFEDVMRTFFKACEQGFLTGCGGYFDFSLKLDSPLDAQKEKFTAEALCMAQIGSGCDLVATYLMSEALNEDQHKLALPYWRKGCEVGYEVSCRAYAGNMDYFDNLEEFHWAVNTACEHGFDPSKWPQDARVDYPSCSPKSPSK